MEIKKIRQDFSICKVKDLSQVDFLDEFCFLAKTEEELSLVCSSERVPNNILACEEGWKAFRIQGVLDFSMIGILSKISSLLAEKEISIFVVSTFNTDYIWIKKENFEKAMDILKGNGYKIIE